MYSAEVNAALAEFFSLADTEAGNIPLSGNTPATSASNIPTKITYLLVITYL